MGFHICRRVASNDYELLNCAKCYLLLTHQTPQKVQLEHSPLVITPANQMSKSLSFPKETSEPRCNDVLFGKGHKSQNHPGNLVFRQIAERHRAAYTQATRRYEKDHIAKIIIENVTELKPPGRFLKMEMDGKYYVITNDEAEVLSKVKQILRKNNFESMDTSEKNQTKSAFSPRCNNDVQKNKQILHKRGRDSTSSSELGFTSSDMQRVLKILRSLSPEK